MLFLEKAYDFVHKQSKSTEQDKEKEKSTIIDRFKSGNYIYFTIPDGLRFSTTKSRRRRDTEGNNIKQQQELMKQNILDPEIWHKDES